MNVLLMCDMFSGAVNIDSAGSIISLGGGAGPPTGCFAEKGMHYK